MFESFKLSLYIASNSNGDRRGDGCCSRWEIFLFMLVRQPRHALSTVNAITLAIFEIASMRRVTSIDKAVTALCNNGDGESSHVQAEIM